MILGPQVSPLRGEWAGRPETTLETYCSPFLLASLRQPTWETRLCLLTGGFSGPPHGLGGPEVSLPPFFLSAGLPPFSLPSPLLPSSHTSSNPGEGGELVF